MQRNSIAPAPDDPIRHSVTTDSDVLKAIRLLESTDDAVRYSAVVDLFFMGKRALSALIDALRHANPVVRRCAAVALERSPSLGLPFVALTALLEATNDACEGVRLFASMSIVDIVGNMTPNLRGQLGGSDLSRSRDAATIIAKSVLATMNAATTLLDNGEQWTDKVYRRLSKCHRFLIWALPIMSDMIIHADSDIRASAEEVIAHIHSQCITIMKNVRADPRYVKCNMWGEIDAIALLGRLLPMAKAAIPKAITMLSHPNKAVRRGIRYALLQIGQGAVLSLAAGLTHRRWRVREQSALVLGKIGDLCCEAITELSRGAGDPDVRVRIACVRALSCQTGASAVEWLTQITAPNSPLRRMGTTLIENTFSLYVFLKVGEILLEHKTDSLSFNRLKDLLPTLKGIERSPGAIREDLKAVEVFFRTLNGESRSSRKLNADKYTVDENADYFDRRQGRTFRILTKGWEAWEETRTYFAGVVHCKQWPAE